MYQLDYCEFYITNVCNLNCTNCNRFNNYAFSGHYNWHDHVDQYMQWAKLIDVKTIGILGGEPFLNPGFFDWVNGVAELWPHSHVRIITNGTQLNRYPELYNTLLKYNGRVSVEINNHNKAQKQSMIDNIKGLLKGHIQSTKIDFNPGSWTKTYSDIRDASWPDCETVEDFCTLPARIQDELRNMHGLNPEAWVAENYDEIFVDSNNIRIQHRPAWSFNECSIKFDPYKNNLSLHNSDPEKSMAVCYFKTCHHFIQGKLYKCGPVGILPEFIKQFPVQATPRQQSLIESYQPADPNWDDKMLSVFVDNLKTAKAIDQCALCPETFTPQEFNAGTKKIKIVKI